MTRHFMELAFTESVQNSQEMYGTREAYKKMESRETFRNKLTWQEKSYIKSRNFFYMSTVGESGWPYMQYRGGPEGFLKVVNDDTLAFADFKGNGQYITTGNLGASPKTLLFLMDYVRQQRLKIWAESEVLNAEDDLDLLKAVTVPGYPGNVERIIKMKVHAFDWNCPQHITPRYSLEEIEAGMVNSIPSTL